MKQSHQALGREARNYREARRIRLREVAAKLRGPKGKPFDIGNLSRYESGARKMTAEMFSAYCAIVDKLFNKVGK